MWFDSDFSFPKHVQNVCKGCFIQLRDFRNIRQFLTHDAYVSIAYAFVSSWLDYCNSLFRSLSKFNLHTLQSIQNSAVRIATNLSKYTQITLVLRKLHFSLFGFAQSSNWLPWCTSLFILVSLNILLHIYPHTALLTILDIIRVLPISSVYQNFNLEFTNLLSSLVSVLPLMLPLFGIHFLKTFMQHPLLPVLERSSKPISTKRYILFSSFSYGFSVVLTYFCPWTLNSDIAFVLLRLRVHYSLEIKHYKSRIRIRIIRFGFNIEYQMINPNSIYITDNGQFRKKHINYAV